MDKEKIVDIEIIHKEIDLIQSCILRMANNSFLLKGWMISLIAVILAIMPEKINTFMVIGILICIIICFWYLDAYFLRLEKMYRELYTWVIKERLQNNESKLYDLNPYRFSTKVGTITEVMISKTLRWFYGIPLVLVLIIGVYNF